MNAKTVGEISRILIGFEIRKAQFTPGWRPNAYLEIKSPRIATNSDLRTAVRTGPHRQLMDARLALG